jgi:hypothetical protein
MDNDLVQVDPNIGESLCDGFDEMLEAGRSTCEALQGCNPLILALFGEREGSEGSGFGVEKQLQNKLVMPIWVEDDSPGFSNFSNAFLKLGQLILVMMGPKIEDTDVLHNAKPMLRINDGIERAVKLAASRLNQPMLEAINYLMFNGFPVCIWNLALLDVNWAIQD